MAALTAFLALTVALVGALLALVTTLTATRVRSGRFVFAALAFLVFTARGVLVIGDGEGWFTSPFPYNAWSVGLDALILGLLYLAIVKE